MRAKRAPNRVHVVSPPSDQGNNDEQNRLIVRMLAQVSDKLKRSEVQREELLKELGQYRKALADLEDKSESSAKAYITLENKIKNTGSAEAKVSERISRFEKSIKDTEARLVKAAAGQALVDQRFRDTEDKFTAVTERLDETAAQQTRLDHKIEKINQDKARFVRKVERLEEIVTETQDALRAKALVLLTDQSTAAQGHAPQIPAWLGDGTDLEDPKFDKMSVPWWRKTSSMQNASMVGMILVAVLLGAAIVRFQAPAQPQTLVIDPSQIANLNVAALENDTIDIQANDFVPASRITELNNLEDQKLSERLPQTSSDEVFSINEDTPQNFQADAAPVNLTEDYSSDAQLLAALEDNPDTVAEQLNTIEPAVAAALDIEPPKPEAKPLSSLDKVAFRQDPELSNIIRREQTSVSLQERIRADGNLPDVVKQIEAQAFQGVAEAQHDLAAIYTAGHGGVQQNFEKAATWFVEASQNGIPNAQYNLGVLYHQGLGVERDLGRALYWYREAAKENHPEAQYNLGIAHIEGIGTDYNADLAAAFFEQAANNGIVEAGYNLGLIYENGLLGEANPESALFWYKIASDQGSPDAQTAMEQLASSLQIGMEDVAKLVERKQSIYEANNGDRAGTQSPQNSQSSNANDPVRLLTSQIQEQLSSFDLYPGNPDGLYGPMTQRAIKAYQAQNNLAITGKPSEELLIHMLARSLQNSTDIEALGEGSRAN